jgi:hypothetical protein
MQLISLSFLDVYGVTSPKIAKEIKGLMAIRKLQSKVADILSKKIQFKWAFKFILKLTKKLIEERLNTSLLRHSTEF